MSLLNNCNFIAKLVGGPKDGQEIELNIRPSSLHLMSLCTECDNFSAPLYNIHQYDFTGQSLSAYQPIYTHRGIKNG